MLVIYQVGGRIFDTYVCTSARYLVYTMDGPSIEAMWRQYDAPMLRLQRIDDSTNDSMYSISHV